jgi:hypothetical protein
MRKYGMIEPRRPKIGDIVHYWTQGAEEHDPAICNVAIITAIVEEGSDETRPQCNMTVFRAEDSRPWARLKVPRVHDDGGVPILFHKYTLPGDYE